ncbi:hypothetical protein HDE_00604 [Halotydeus destructor]|nr:hypothetical protein HDE_00604 [Halotydeus destructor]
MTITTCLGAESWAVDRSSFREALRGQSLEETFGQAENRYEDSYGGINVAPRGNLKTVPRMSFKDYSQQVVTNEDNYGSDGQSQAPGYAGQGNNRRGGASYGGSQSGSRKASGYGQAKISAGGYGSSSAYGSEPQYENLGLRAYGRPGQDFPTYEYVPETGFDCKSQSYPGYYADTGAQCQAFYICQADGRQDGFLCPNATLFNQELFVCDYWQNVDCSLAPSFYGLNGNLVSQ